MCAKSLQSYLTLFNLMDYCSLPGYSVHGILQATVLEWVATPFSRGSSQPRDQTWVSCIAGRFFTIWAKVGDNNGIVSKNQRKSFMCSDMERYPEEVVQFLKKKEQDIYNMSFCVRKKITGLP